MRINEAASAVGCTQRAIKFYEEKGLMPAVSRSENGYRDYKPEDIARLHEIQAYRKLGIGVSDIKKLLASEERDDILRGILEQKRKDISAAQQEIAAFEAFLHSQDSTALDEAVDFASIAEAIRAQLPGAFGAYLASHFAPYLSIRIATAEQQDAYQRILAFWDNPGLRLPVFFRLSMLFPAPSAQLIDANLQAMLNPSEQAYERMKAQTLRTIRLRETPLVRYSPPEIAKRSMMKRLKDCGYYDVFLPQLERLSPAYKAYRDALHALNTRLCDDLGLHYDASFHLVCRK